MEDLKLEISDYYELLNLHKALLEAKFHDNPDNIYVSGSPFVAKLCNKVVDLLTQYEINNSGKDNWTEWRKLHNQTYYKNRAMDAIVRFGNWKNNDINEKINMVFNYISPFTCSEEEIIMLIDEIDILCN